GLFQIADFAGNVNFRNLAEKITRRVRPPLLRMKDGVNRVACAKLKAIIALQFLAIDALAVHERSVLAALVLHIKTTVFRNNQRMIPRDTRVGDNEVFVHLAADAEGRVIEVERSLLATVDEDQAGEDTGTGCRDLACVFPSLIFVHGGEQRTLYLDHT